MAVSAATITRVRLSDLSPVTADDAIHDDLERLLFTRIGEQVGFLTKGCRLVDFMDEPSDQNTAMAALDEVITCIALYMPQIQLTQAQVTIENRGLIVLLEFNYNGVVYRDSLTYAKAA